MNIQAIMDEIDVLYSAQKVEEVEALLLEKIQLLKENHEIYPAISLLNELLGIYREKGDCERGSATCQEVLGLFQQEKLPLDGNYGTTLLNVATAHRAFGNYALSKQYYETCNEIFFQHLKQNDYRYASLYNNMSLLFGELGELKQSIDYLEKSLEILRHHENMEVQIATANTSMAQMYLGLEDVASAEKHLDIAMKMFENVEDYHYSATLATGADIAYLKGDFKKSAVFYQKAMDEIEKYVGITENYKLLEENLNHVKELLQPKGLEQSRLFYEEFGIPMIQKHFPQYEEKIAVGLVGQGSECFGFDDEISHDHDFGAGFCLWLTEDIYDEIGEELQKQYDLLPETFQGITRITVASGRVGVFQISDFYMSLTGLEGVPQEEFEWMFLEDAQLASATNGAVFCDDLGKFTEIRNVYLGHYPEGVRRKKIAEKSHLVSQMGQYNFQRMLKRGDFFTARLILSDFMKHTMELVFLLNKTYAPFYKWTFKKFQELPLLSHLSGYFLEIEKSPLESNKINEIIEKIVADLIDELENQQYIKKNKREDALFLDRYVQEMLS